MPIPASRSRQADLRQTDPRYDHGPYDQGDAAGYEPEYEEDRYAGEYDEQAYVDPAHGRRRWLYIGGRGSDRSSGGGRGRRLRLPRVVWQVFRQLGADHPSRRHPDQGRAADTAQTGEGGQKLIYDRLDGPKPSERIVSREEQPAEVAQNTGRVVTAPQPAGPVTAFAPVADHSAERARGDHR